MLTRRIDRALEAFHQVKRRFPDLAMYYPPGSPKRIALEDAAAAVERAYGVVFPTRNGPTGRS